MKIADGARLADLLLELADLINADSLIQGDPYQNIQLFVTATEQGLLLPYDESTYLLSVRPLLPDETTGKHVTSNTEDTQKILLRLLKAR